MTESEENIITLLQKVAIQLFPDDYLEKEDNRRIMMEKIQSRNTELYLAIKDFILAYESLEFIASDYQLRLKAADIWKSQKEMFVDVLKTRSEDLKTAATNSNINIEVELKSILILSE